MAFSELKALLRKAAARTVDQLWSAVATFIAASGDQAVNIGLHDQLQHSIGNRPQRSVEIDLARFPTDENAVGRVFRRSQCGAKGHCIVSAPTPGAPRLVNDFYGRPGIGPSPEPIRKRRRRR